MEKEFIKWKKEKIEDIIKSKNWSYKKLKEDIYEIPLSYYDEVHSIKVYLRSYYIIVSCDSIYKLSSVEVRSYKQLNEYLDIFHYEIKKSVWSKKDYVDKLLYIGKEDSSILERVINIHCDNIYNSISKAGKYIDNIKRV